MIGKTLGEIVKIKDPIAFGAGFLVGFYYVDWWRRVVSVLLSLPLALLLLIVGGVAVYFARGSTIRIVPEFSSGFSLGVLIREASPPA